MYQGLDHTVSTGVRAATGILMLQYRKYNRQAQLHLNKPLENRAALRQVTSSLFFDGRSAGHSV